MTRSTALKMLEGFVFESETESSLINADAWTIEAFRALHLRKSKVGSRIRLGISPMTFSALQEKYVF